MGAVQGKFEVMKQSCPAAGVAAFARAKFELLQREHSQRSTSTSSLWRRLALLALCCVAPTAFAADLQISNLSDTGYDPTPVGGPVVYHVVVENGDIDTVSDAVALFDLPAGATPGTLPAFCASLGGSPESCTRCMRDGHIATSLHQPGNDRSSTFCCRLA